MECLKMLVKTIYTFRGRLIAQREAYRGVPCFVLRSNAARTFFMAPGTEATTLPLFGAILFRSKRAFRSGWVRRHEYAHILQMRRYGSLVFMLLYWYYLYRYGYSENPFEVEANVHARRGSIGGGDDGS